MSEEELSVKLEVENNEGGEDESEEYFSSEDYSIALEKYFDFFGNFFPNAASKGIFLVGVATGKLLRAQKDRFKQEAGLEPFWRSLYNLVLNKKRLMSIHVKVVSKLKLYKKEKYPKKLMQNTSDYLMKAGSDFGLSDIEISWFFALGLSSYQNVTNKTLAIYLINE